MKIGLITTLDTNLGDDLVREGIIVCLHLIFPEEELVFSPVNKHRPLTVYPRWHPIRLGDLAYYLPRGSRRVPALMSHLFSSLHSTAFDRCDLIVQCGAPVFWEKCHACEFAIALWHHVVGRLASRVPVLNLAAGSCYAWEREPEDIDDPRDATYLRAILGYCRLTTSRDRLAQKLCRSLGTEVPLLPCSALLAAGQAMPGKSDGGYILINYMSGGGHYDFDQGIDPSAWKQTVRSLVERLRGRYKLVFLCHNQLECRLAEELDPTITRLWPRTPREFFALAAEARGAVCNRLHASVGLAGLGVPSVGVGTDTRMLMLEEIGLPYFYVKDANAENLEAALEELLARRYQERERLLELRRKTLLDYCDAVAGVLGVVDRSRPAGAVHP